MYGQPQAPKAAALGNGMPGSGLRNGNEVGGGGARGMGVYEGGQVQRHGDGGEGEVGGNGKKKGGFLGVLCCRG